MEPTHPSAVHLLPLLHDLTQVNLVSLNTPCAPCCHGLPGPSLPPLLFGEPLHSSQASKLESEQSAHVSSSALTAWIHEDWLTVSPRPERVFQEGRNQVLPMSVVPASILAYILNVGGKKETRECHSVRRAAMKTCQEAGCGAGRCISTQTIQRRPGGPQLCTRLIFDRAPSSSDTIGSH